MNHNIALGDMLLYYDQHEVYCELIPQSAEKSPPKNAEKHLLKIKVYAFYILSSNLDIDYILISNT